MMKSIQFTMTLFNRICCWIYPFFHRIPRWNLMSSGAYILCLELSKSISVQIGKLGMLDFQAGFYYYVGSAFNPKQKYPLEKRIIRHLKPLKFKNMHWHIDYVLAIKDIRVHSIFMIPSRSKEECEIAAIIKESTESDISRFGCSDCKCTSHLFYSRKNLFS